MYLAMCEGISGFWAAMGDIAPTNVPTVLNPRPYKAPINEDQNIDPNPLSLSLSLCVCVLRTPGFLEIHNPTSCIPVYNTISHVCPL